MTAIPPPVRNHKWVGYLTVVILVVVVGIFVSGINPITLISPLLGLVLTLIGVALLIGVGEWITKKLALTGFGMWGVRIPLIGTGLLLLWLAISQLNFTGIPASAGMPDWLEKARDAIGWFGILAVVVIGLTLTFGAWRYSKIPGNTSAYLFMGVVALIMIFGALYIVGQLVAPTETSAILEAAKNEAASAAGSLVTHDEHGDKRFNREVFVGVEWEKVGGILFVCVLGYIFIHQYASKNKIVVTVAAVVASIAFVLTSYYFATKWETSNRIIQGVGTAVQEVNPLAGETHYVRLDNAPHVQFADIRTGYPKPVTARSLTVFNIGPYDRLIVYLPPQGCSLRGQPTEPWRRQFGDRWDDPAGYIAKVAGGATTARTYELSGNFQDWLRASDARLELRLWAECL